MGRVAVIILAVLIACGVLYATEVPNAAEAQPPPFSSTSIGPFFEALPTSGDPPLEVTFTVLAEGSSPTGAFARYEWNFDCDASDTPNIIAEVAYGNEAPESWTWVYDEHGAFSIRLGLTDYDNDVYQIERSLYIWTIPQDVM